MKTLNPFPYTDTSAAEDFLKHCGKTINCSWWAISPYQIIISHWAEYFCLNVFKVVSCRFVVSGKGLRFYLHKFYLIQFESGIPHYKYMYIRHQCWYKPPLYRHLLQFDIHQYLLKQLYTGAFTISHICYDASFCNIIYKQRVLESYRLLFCKW